MGKAEKDKMVMGELVVDMIGARAPCTQTR